MDEISEARTGPAAERVEAEFMFAYEALAPAPVRAELGIATSRIGGGVALSVRNDPTRYWSKAVGFTDAVTSDLVAELVDFYRANNDTSFTLQVAPFAQPDDWPDIVARHGLVAESTLVKLARSADPRALDPVSTATVRPMKPADADSWARAVARGFDMPENAVVDMAAAAVREQHPGFSAWGLIVDDRIVGGAALYVDQDVASLNSGAVLPEYRRRGGQAALIEHRVAAARQQGCRVLVAETDKPAPGAVNPSLSNLLRHGFLPLYERTNWVWTRS